MSDPKDPKSATEPTPSPEATQAGLDELFAALPPELKHFVEQAEGAFASADPAAAFEALAASDAVAAVLERLFDLGLSSLLGPVLGDVRALDAELRALPEALEPLRGDPAKVQPAVQALEERVLHLQAAAAALSGAELLQELARALGEAEALLDVLGAPSPALSLTRAAVLARAGDRVGSQAGYARALDVAEAAGAMEVAATAATGIQLDALQRRDLRAALDLSRRIAALARRCGDLRRAVLSTYDEGLLLARLGKAGEGEPLVIGALDEARALDRPELIARGMVVMAKIREGAGDDRGARGLYEGLLAYEGAAELEGEVAQGAMGVLRLLESEDLLDPMRLRCLPIVRAWSRKTGDAENFAQMSLLLAESEEARGDRQAALRAVVEGRDVMREAPGSNPEPMDRALRQLRAEWGAETFDALLRKVEGPPPAEA